jgi:hypothetical protein
LEPILSPIERGELAVLDHWLDPVSLQKSAQRLWIIAIVGGDRLDAIDIPRQQLLADLSVVWFLRRTMHIQDGSRRTIDQQRRLHGLEGVVGPVGVLPAGGDAVEPACIDRLHLAEVLEFARQIEESSQFGM